MKKATLTLICFMLLSFTGLQAQETSRNLPSNELNINYGILGSQDIFALIYSFSPFFFDPFNYNIDQLNSSSGILGVTYSRYFNKFRLSGSFNFERASFGIIGPLGNIIGKKYYLDFYSLLLRWDFFYLTKEYVALYSGIALGGSIVSSKEDPIFHSKDLSLGLFAYQINAIGIRLGYRIGAFAEIGFGFQGILRTGISVKF